MTIKLASFVAILWVLSSVPASAACMVGDLKFRTADERQRNPQKSLQIEVPDEAVGKYAAEGFSVVECTKTRAEREQYRNHICEVADFGNTAVQNQLAVYFPDRPENLCAAAEALIGKRPAKGMDNEAEEVAPVLDDPEPLPEG
jgi:hypothetical protein